MVGLTSMTAVGTIAFGPELRRKPITAAIDRLALDLDEPLDRSADDYDLDFVFVVPGSLGAPDFEGILMGPISAAERRAQVMVAVPREVADQDEPDRDLIALALAGVDAATEALEKRRVAVPFTALRTRLESLAARHRPAPLSTSIAIAALGRSRLDGASERPEASPSIEVRLRLTEDVRELDKARDLEDDLAASVERSGVGHVDGNEIGGGSYVIFLEGANVAELERAVRDVLLSRWPKNRADVVLAAGGDEATVVNEHPRGSG